MMLFCGIELIVQQKQKKVWILESGWRDSSEQVCLKMHIYLVNFYFLTFQLNSIPGLEDVTAKSALTPSPVGGQTSAPSADKTLEESSPSTSAPSIAADDHDQVGNSSCILIVRLFFV